MPLIATNPLPAFEALRKQGVNVVNADEADAALPELHIALLNLMPDAALRATERQFLRLVASYADKANVIVHVFTVAQEHRGEEAQAHIRNWYSDFDSVRKRGVDALIITGANPEHELLPDETFWLPLLQVIDWARESLPTVLCSCLATHAVMEYLFHETRVRLPAKRWGVYNHAIVHPAHALMAGISAPVSAPHSHYFDISRRRMEAAGATVLVHSDTAGVYLAVAGKGTRWVFFQGHPEYDRVSLLKEYKREIVRHAGGDREYPPYPDHYFPTRCFATLANYQSAALSSIRAGHELPPFPEETLLPDVVNTWQRAGLAVFRNWLADVHRHKTETRQ